MVSCLCVSRNIRSWDAYEYRHETIKGGGKVGKAGLAKCKESVMKSMHV